MERNAGFPSAPVAPELPTVIVTGRFALASGFCVFVFSPPTSLEQEAKPNANAADNKLKVMILIFRSI